MTDFSGFLMGIIRMMYLNYVISTPPIPFKGETGRGVIHSRNGYVLEFGFDLGKKEHSESFSLTVTPG